jgi:hypothetical protein
MTEGQFETLIERLEVYARQHPTAYRVKVGLLASLGYAYVFAVMALCAFVVVGVILLSFWYRVMNFMTIKFLLIPRAMQPSAKLPTPACSGR